jgi:type I restriction enzyme S subunit
MKPSNVALGELTKIRTGKLDANAANHNGAYPFFTCAVEPLSINTAAFDCKAVLVAGNGDLNVKYYEGKFNAYQRTYVIESLDESKLYPKYLYFFLDKYVEKLREQAIGGVIKYIKLENLTNAKIPLLPLAEQKLLVAILDKATEIKSKREQTIAKIDELAQSTFVEMFGNGMVRANKYVSGELGLGITLVGGGAFKNKDFLDAGIPLIRIGEVNRQDFDSTSLPCLPTEFETKYSRFLVKNGDLLMSLTGTTGKQDYGNVSLLNGFSERYFLNQRVALIKPKEDKFITEYLLYLFKNKDVKNKLISRSRGVRQANISNGDILGLNVQFPPIAKQIEFKDVIKKIHFCMNVAEHGLTKSSLLLSSLKNQAFITGLN